jgi:hypothetical protein
MKDLWFNIVPLCDLDSLKNLYFVNKTIKSLLDESYTLKQLTKFNNLYNDSFNDFVTHCGHFMVPNITHHVKKYSYITSCNGEQKYIVELTDKHVIVRINNYDSDDSDSDECLHDLNTNHVEYDIQKYFVGKSYKTSMTMWCATYIYFYDGNTILLHLTDGNYVFISNYIYKFKSVGKIINYFSPVGNNDVPYPYAVDEYNNIYLLIEYIYLPMSLELIHKMINHKYNDDPYLYYYNNEDTMTYPIIKL